MGEAVHDPNGVNASIEPCKVHGDKPWIVDTEQGQVIMLRDLDDYFDCKCLPGSLEEKLHNLRVNGLTLLDELAANFTYDPQIVDAVQWVHEHVNRAPIPLGDDQIRLEGQDWSAVIDLWKSTQMLLSRKDKAAPG